MPYAFTHIISAWIIVKIVQFLTKLKPTRLEWFLLFFGAVLPDIDYILEWVFGSSAHRLFTHSFLMLIFVFILSYFIFRILSAANTIEKSKPLTLTIYLCSGVFIHLLADFLFSFQAGIPLFWPYPNYYGLLSGMQTPVQLALIDFMAVPVLYSKLKLAIFDMALGVSWLFYLIYKGRIKEF